MKAEDTRKELVGQATNIDSCQVLTGHQEKPNANTITIPLKRYLFKPGTNDDIEISSAKFKQTFGLSLLTSILKSSPQTLPSQTQAVL